MTKHTKLGYLSSAYPEFGSVLSSASSERCKEVVAAALRMIPLSDIGSLEARNALHDLLAGQVLTSETIKLLNSESERLLNESISADEDGYDLEAIRLERQGSVCAAIATAAEHPQPLPRDVDQCLYYLSFIINRDFLAKVLV